MSVKQATCEAFVVLWRGGGQCCKSALAVCQAPQTWMQDLVGRHFQEVAAEMSFVSPRSLPFKDFVYLKQRHAQLELDLSSNAYTIPEVTNQ